MNTDQEDCLQLQHDTQRILRRVTQPLVPPQMVQQIMDSMRLPSMMQNFVENILERLSIAASQVTIDELPKSQCVWIPHAPNANIIRIVGHYQGEKKSNPQLIISSDPVNCNKTEQQTCSTVCEDKTEQECMCIDTDEPISQFDEMNYIRHGFEQTTIWVTSHIDGGRKYVTTCDGNIGFQVFGLFTHDLHHGDPTNRKINNLKIAPGFQIQSDSMYIGGASVKNVLVHHLNDIGTLKRGINLVVQSNSNDTKTSDESEIIEISIIPLINEPGLQKQFNQYCSINEDNPEQCTVYLEPAFDYDIRFENHGQKMVDVDISTIEMPINHDIAATPTPETLKPPLPLAQQSGRPSPIFNIVTAVGIIIIALIALFSILGVGRRRRKAKAKQAFLDDNGELIAEEQHKDTETPFVSMDEYKFSYNVFSTDHTKLETSKKR